MGTKYMIYDNKRQEITKPLSNPSYLVTSKIRIEMKKKNDMTA